MGNGIDDSDSNIRDPIPGVHDLHSFRGIEIHEVVAQADVDLTVRDEHFDVNVVFSVVPKALLSNNCDHFFEGQPGEVTAAVFDAPVSTEFHDALRSFSNGTIVVDSKEQHVLSRNIKILLRNV